MRRDRPVRTGGTFAVAAAVILAGLLALATAHAAADGALDPDAPDLAPHERYAALMARATERQKRLRSLEASFVQRKENPLLLEPEVARGTLVYRAPDRLRWDFQAPTAMVVITRGRELLTRYPGSDDVERRDLGPRAGRLLELFGPGASLERLARYFTIHAVFPEEKTEPYRLELTPSVPQVARRIRALALHLDRALLVPVYVRTVEAGGGVTELTLTDLVLDREIPDARFELTPRR